MKSSVLPSFWAEYRRLNDDVRQSARKAYRLWAENPFHPSLHFKCINIAYFLLHSLDKGVDDEVKDAWDAELTQRLEESGNGTADGESSGKIFPKLREKYFFLSSTQATLIP